MFYTFLQTGGRIVSISKADFIEVVEGLLNGLELDKREIYKRKIIGRTKLNAILDPESNTFPDLPQSLALAEMLETNLYYLATKKGPKHSPPEFTKSMIDIMDAYLDDKRPNISLVIDMITQITDRETLLLIRKMVTQIIETRGVFSENDSLQRALRHSFESRQ